MAGYWILDTTTNFVAVCRLAQLPSHIRKQLRESGFLQWKHDSEKTSLPSTWVWQPLGYIMRTKCQRLRRSGQISMTSVTTKDFFLSFVKKATTTPLWAFRKGRLVWGSAVQRMASLWSHTTVKPGHIRGEMMDARSEPLCKQRSTASTWLQNKPVVIFTGFYFPRRDYLTSACVNSTVDPLFVSGQTIVGSPTGENCITANKMDTKQAAGNFNIFVRFRWVPKLIITIITGSLLSVNANRVKKESFAENSN